MRITLIEFLSYYNKLLKGINNNTLTQEQICSIILSLNEFQVEIKSSKDKQAFSYCQKVMTNIINKIAQDRINNLGISFENYFMEMENTITNRCLSTQEFCNYIDMLSLAIKTNYDLAECLRLSCLLQGTQVYTTDYNEQIKYETYMSTLTTYIDKMQSTMVNR